MRGSLIKVQDSTLEEAVGAGWEEWDTWLWAQVTSYPQFCDLGCMPDPFQSLISHGPSRNVQPPFLYGEIMKSGLWVKCNECLRLLIYL